MDPKSNTPNSSSAAILLDTSDVSSLTLPSTLLHQNHHPSQKGPLHHRHHQQQQKLRIISESSPIQSKKKKKGQQQQQVKNNSRSRTRTQSSSLSSPISTNSSSSEYSEDYSKEIERVQQRISTMKNHQTHQHGDHQHHGHVPYDEQGGRHPGHHHQEEEEDDVTDYANDVDVHAKPTFDTNATSGSNSSPEEHDEHRSDDDDDNEEEKTTNNGRRRGVVIAALVFGVLILLGVIAVIVYLAVHGEKREGGNGLFGLRKSRLPNFPTSAPTAFHTTQPSSSMSPTNVPSMEPTMKPSNGPSLLPSVIPTTTPSELPTNAPTTTPTPGPTPAPTMEYIPVNAVPDNPPRGYFNYDRNDYRYGPNAWHRIDTSQSFLREFGWNGWGPWRGHITDVDPTLNVCDGPDRKQSPKNLYATMECDAHHEIRTAVSKTISIFVLYSFMSLVGRRLSSSSHTSPLFRPSSRLVFFFLILSIVWETTLVG